MHIRMRPDIYYAEGCGGKQENWNCLSYHVYVRYLKMWRFHGDYMQGILLKPSASSGRGTLSTLRTSTLTPAVGSSVTLPLYHPRRFPCRSGVTYIAFLWHVSFIRCLLYSHVYIHYTSSETERRFLGCGIYVTFSEMKIVKGESERNGNKRQLRHLTEEKHETP